MKPFLLPRRRPVLKLGVALAATLFSVAACGTSGGSAPGAAAAVPGPTLAALRASVTQAEQVPSFAAPGPEFDAGKARGKTTASRSTRLC